MSASLSIVIPAYNEEALIGATLQAARDALIAAGLEDAEIIVADDASTDATAELAQRAGARVVTTSNRQIAATRNAGAREARGEFLLFLDADTLLPADTLRAGVNALRDGAVGCGVRLQFDQKPGFVMRCVVWGIESTLRACRYAPGCCVFVRRDVFERVGGFPEEFYASEEIWLSRALKREGSFRMLQESVVTSARKMNYHSTGRILWMMVRVLLRGRGGVTSRDGLELWYDGQRG